MIDAFLLGVIVTSSLVASAFFFKFWKQTHDLLFLGFCAAFFIEGINRVAFLFVEQSGAASLPIYAVRLLSYLLILAVIMHKNRG